MHDEIRRVKENDIDFSLSDSIESTNKDLWDFICSCTRSVQERTGRQTVTTNTSKHPEIFYDYVFPQLSDHNPSLIYYMEVLDENADSQVLSDTQKWVLSG